MLLFFTGNTGSTLAIFRQMQSAASDVLINRNLNFNPIQVKTQVPSWMNDVNSNMVEFVQSYYDWMTNSFGYSGTNVMDISKVFDVDEAPEYILPHFIETYAPDIKSIYKISPELRPTANNIRKTLVNIKTELYQKKSNEDAFRSMMVSLFGISAATINLSYPKRKIMRLNAGKLDWMSDSNYYGITGNEYSSERYTMIGSHLNQGVFQDGGMWQDFSYVLTSEIDDSNPYYEAVVKETLHPAGLLGLYEKVERFSEGGFEPGPIVTYENPKISNYYPYTLGSTGTLNRCSGCVGSLFRTGWTFPTFVYPSWDDLIGNGPSADFGSIIIRDFFELNSADGSASPNDLIGTTCGFACGACGAVEFSWEVGVDQTYTGGNVYTEVPEENLFLRTERFLGLNLLE